MQAFGRHDMSFHKAKERIERRTDRADRIGHGRQRNRHAFQGITLGLTVQGLVLAELLEHDHRQQQARPRPSPRDDMERRRRLADLLAIPAGELLPNGLDHLPLPRLRFQRPCHILSELAQAIAAAAFACRRWVDHHALAGKMVGERIAVGTLARKSGDRCRSGNCLFRRKFVFCRAGFQLFEGERQLIDQARRALRPLPVDLPLQFRDPQLLLRNQRHVFRRFRAGDRQFRRNVQALGLRNGQRRFQGGVFMDKSGASGIHETK
ncbi:hypothetical protein AMST5_02900 [freshwater sediment metagenome]|uniref:Uncharacterized protein n=1 Tax=freshwater sediment metagenome TaxID=556182 RepID=A0AA48RB74_9ZZZZ